MTANDQVIQSIFFLHPYLTENTRKKIQAMVDEFLERLNGNKGDPLNSYFSSKTFYSFKHENYAIHHSNTSTNILTNIKITDYIDNSTLPEAVLAEGITLVNTAQLHNTHFSELVDYLNNLCEYIINISNKYSLKEHDSIALFFHYLPDILNTEELHKTLQIPSSVLNNIDLEKTKTKLQTITESEELTEKILNADIAKKEAGTNAIYYFYSADLLTNF